MLIIGSHVGYKKDSGLVGSVEEALSYGANTFMFYTGAPQNTIRSSIDLDNVNKAYVLMSDNGIDKNNVIVHAPYIINLASYKEDTYTLAKEFLALELERTAAIGSNYLVLHPGSFTDKIVSVSSFSNGIVYLDAAFDVSDFSIEELESLNVYARLLTMCSTREKEMVRVQTDIRYTSGGYAFYIESGMSLDGKVKNYLLFRMRALKETARDALMEFISLLKDGLVLEDELENALIDISTDYKSGVIQSGHSYAISASSASLSPSLYIGEKLSGLSFWYTIEKKRGDIRSEKRRIESVKSKLLSSSRISVQTYSDKENEAYMQDIAKYFGK